MCNAKCFTYNLVRSFGSCLKTAARFLSVMSRHLADVPVQVQRSGHLRANCKLVNDFVDRTSCSNAMVKATFMTNAPNTFTRNLQSLLSKILHLKLMSNIMSTLFQQLPFYCCIYFCIEISLLINQPLDVTSP